MKINELMETKIEIKAQRIMRLAYCCKDLEEVKQLIDISLDAYLSLSNGLREIAARFLYFDLCILKESKEYSINEGTDPEAFVTYDAILDYIQETIESL